MYPREALWSEICAKDGSFSEYLMIRRENEVEISYGVIPDGAVCLPHSAWCAPHSLLVLVLVLVLVLLLMLLLMLTILICKSSVAAQPHMSDTSSYSPSKPNEDKGRLLVLDPADHDGDTGPFKLCWFDFRPCNILVDKDTLQITAILNLELTNAMPAQFAHEPFWWLLLRRRPIKTSRRGRFYGGLPRKVSTMTGPIS